MWRQAPTTQLLRRLRAASLEGSCALLAYPPFPLPTCTQLCTSTAAPLPSLMTLYHLYHDIRTPCITKLRSFASAAPAAKAATPSSLPSRSQRTATESQLPAIAVAEHTTQGEYRDVQVPLFDNLRNPVGQITLPGDIFDVPIRRDILHRVVRWQLARKQQGTHKAKTRAEVRGGGRKPWKQKGTGRARQGSIRAPQFRGGGVVHGPVPRSHAHSLPSRVRRLGLKCALSAKAWERRLTIVDSLRPEDHKTKTVAGHVNALLVDAPRVSILMIDAAKDGEDGGQLLRRGAANLQWVDVLPVVGVNVYSMLQRDHLVMTKAALESLVLRLRRPIKPCSFTP